MAGKRLCSLCLGVSCLATWVAGCTTAPRMHVRAERFRIEAQFDPETHSIRGRTAIDVVRADDRDLPADGAVAVELLLHPDLKITSVRAAGAEVLPSFIHRAAPAESTAAGRAETRDFEPKRHLVYLDRPAPAGTIFVEYEGLLYQDAAAGEIEGEIHNFQMRAHVGKDGIYLADGYWYPQPQSQDDTPALADFTLVVDPVADFELAVSGEWDEALAAQTGRLAWRSPYRLEEMVLVGGRHQIHRKDVNGIAVALHLKAEQSQHVEGLFTTVERLLQRYEPLVGEYPATEYKVVDNFFSSGFAFPTFTLLSSAVIDMGERAQTTHGYFDHEMLHSWWGNGIHVDPRDGNWCEALASYGANYYGFVLDGDQEEARRKRRNFSHFLSRIKPEDDKPLGTYGQKDGCNRSIAYDKGAAVFHMLAWSIGQDAFWAAMRKLTTDYVGRFASWSDIREVCEAESGKDLSAFFDQWVRRGGAPLLVVEEAAFSSADQSLILTISQGKPAFDLTIPIRITRTDGTDDVAVALSEPRKTVSLPVDGIPMTVELDPDYHIFRRILPEQVLPTTASTRHGEAFTAVAPQKDAPAPYQKIREVFESSFEPDERIEAVAGAFDGEQLAERCVLILGDAVNDPYISAFLSAVQFPVQWHDGGFSFEKVAYNDPGDAVLCTVAHPGVPGGGITVVFANSIEAVPSAFAVPMYDRSLVLFKNGRATLKKDFERRAIITVKRL